jgi:hypothetical protein
MTIQGLKKVCCYYFEMSHLIPNLKCHIERVSSLYLQGEQPAVSCCSLKKSVIKWTPGRQISLQASRCVPRETPRLALGTKNGEFLAIKRVVAVIVIVVTQDKISISSRAFSTISGVIFFMQSVSSQVLLKQGRQGRSALTTL